MRISVKLRHTAAGALALCAGLCATPAAARSQSDSAFDGSWEEAAASVGPVLSHHVFYGNATALDARLGLAFHVASRIAVRASGQGSVTFANESQCVCNVTSMSGTCPLSRGSCGEELGTMWGATIGVGYVDVDATGVPRTIVSIAPGVFGLSGSLPGDGATGFGLEARIEHRLSRGQHAAVLIGTGIRAVLNVHQDTVVEIPLELGGWSW